MKLTLIQIRLVQRSFGRAATKKRLIATLFYDRLLEINPALRSMFKGDMEEQGRKFMRMLALIVSHLHEPEELKRRMQANSQRHARLGIQPEHYQTVCTALLWALEQGLGREFTPAMREAWQAAYALIAEFANPYAAAR
jgi:hemoglobin-like flavoprotein